MFGPVLKLSLRFRKAFWEELDDRKYAGASFFHSAETAFPTFWTSLPLRAPLMTAWMAGPKAARLSTREMPYIVGQALESLSTVFGGRPEQARARRRLPAQLANRPVFAGRIQLHRCGGKCRTRLPWQPRWKTLCSSPERQPTRMKPRPLGERSRAARGLPKKSWRDSNMDETRRAIRLRSRSGVWLSRTIGLAVARPAWHDEAANPRPRCSAQSSPA